MKLRTITRILSLQSRIYKTTGHLTCDKKITEEPLKYTVTFCR